MAKYLIGQKLAATKKILINLPWIYKLNFILFLICCIQQWTNLVGVSSVAYEVGEKEHPERALYNDEVSFWIMIDELYCNLFSS